MTEKRENIVIGGGPAGYTLAIRMAQRGLGVTCIEREEVGGVCLNWGCIPSKALITTATRYDEAAHGESFGVVARGVELNLPQAIKRSREIVHHHTSGVANLLASNGAELIRGTARLVGPKTVLVQGRDGSERRLEATGAIVVATGARPRVLPQFVPSPPDVITAREAVFLEKLPEHLIVLGGGVIGLELGSAYQTLGSRLTVVELGDKLLPGVDADLARVVERRLTKKGAQLLTSARALDYRRKEGGLVLRVEQAGKTLELEGTNLLVAAGFVPNSDNLGLEELGVARDRAGHIQVDASFQTSLEGVYAIGDVSGPPYLAHKAFKESEILTDRLAGLAAVKDYWALPAAIFTEPEIATVGLSEAEARGRYGEIQVGKFPLSALGRAMALGKTDGFVKLLAHNDRLIGAGIVGAEASELISELTLAIEVGATFGDLALTIHPHPTLSEGVGEAALEGLGQALHILNRKKKAEKSAA
jgi:dihydrolipoamide dehydrogenase